MQGFSRRRCGFAPWSRGFAPCTRESLISPLRGANLLPGKAPASVWVCAPHPGKPYSTVEGRKPFAGKSRRRLCGFAPHTRESLILPLRGANFLPGRATGGGGGLRLIPGKALFFRRGAQTFCREKHPAAVRVCASHPGKPYFTVEGRKLFAGKRRRQRCGFAPWSREFAPHTRESLILPLRGANLLPERAVGSWVGLRLIPGKACYEVTVVKRRLQESFISRHVTFVFS